MVKLKMCPYYPLVLPMVFIWQFPATLGVWILINITMISHGFALFKEVHFSIISVVHMMSNVKFEILFLFLPFSALPVSQGDRRNNLLSACYRSYFDVIATIVLPCVFCGGAIHLVLLSNLWGFPNFRLSAFSCFSQQTYTFYCSGLFLFLLSAFYLLRLSRKILG